MSYSTIAEMLILIAKHGECEVMRWGSLGQKLHVAKCLILSLPLTKTQDWNVTLDLHFGLKSGMKNVSLFHSSQMSLS